MGEQEGGQGVNNYGLSVCVWGGVNFPVDCDDCADDDDEDEKGD